MFCKKCVYPKHFYERLRYAASLVCLEVSTTVIRLLLQLVNNISCVVQFGMVCECCKTATMQLVTLYRTVMFINCIRFVIISFCFVSLCCHFEIIVTITFMIPGLYDS